jgi:hypothetical protein
LDVEPSGLMTVGLPEPEVRGGPVHAEANADEDEDEAALPLPLPVPVPVPPVPVPAPFEAVGAGEDAADVKEAEDTNTADAVGEEEGAAIVAGDTRIPSAMVSAIPSVV